MIMIIVSSTRNPYHKCRRTGGADTSLLRHFPAISYPFPHFFSALPEIDKLSRNLSYREGLSPELSFYTNRVWHHIYTHFLIKRKDIYLQKS